MDLFDLVTRWRFTADARPLDVLGSKLDSMNNKLGAFGAVAIAERIYHMVESFSDLGEALQASATSAGLSVEELQKLQYAGSMSAVSSEEMSGALAKLTRSLYSAKQGSSEAIKQFHDVGITQDQIKGFRTSKDALAALADRMKGIQDPIKKQGLAMALLGRGSSNMVGFLSKGSGAIKEMGDEAEAVGAVLTGKQVTALADVEDSLSRLWKVFKTFAAAIAATFAPAIMKMADGFVDLWKANRKFVEVNFDKWAYDISFAFGFVFGIIESLIIKFSRFAKEHGELVMWTGKLVLALGALGAAGAIAAGALSLIASAIIATGIGIAVAALTTAIHDLWVILSGGKYEDTWLYKLEKGFTRLLKMLGIGRAAMTSMVVGSEGTPRSIMPDYGMAEEAEMSTGVPRALVANENLRNFAQAQQPASAALASPAGTAGGPQSVEQTNHIELDAPITVTISGNADPDQAARAARDGISDGIDKLARQVRRSLKPAVVY